MRSTLCAALNKFPFYGFHMWMLLLFTLSISCPGKVWFVIYCDVRSFQGSPLVPRELTFPPVTWIWKCEFAQPDRAVICLYLIPGVLFKVVIHHFNHPLLSQGSSSVLIHSEVSDFPLYFRIEILALMLEFCINISGLHLLCFKLSPWNMLEGKILFPYNCNSCSWGDTSLPCNASHLLQGQRIEDLVDLLLFDLFQLCFSY